MKKYQYNTDFECFERLDNNGNPTGKKLWVNITEARRIVTLHNLGNSTGLIQSKMKFASKNATGHTVVTIIKLYENDEIELDGDYPAPKSDVEDMTFDSRIDALEDRIKVLEEKFAGINCTCENTDKNVLRRIRTWF